MKFIISRFYDLSRDITLSCIINKLREIKGRLLSRSRPCIARCLCRPKAKPESVSFPHPSADRKLADRVALQLLVRIKMLPRRVEIRVPHEPLDRHDVTPAFQKARRVRVPELMKRGIRHFRGIGNLLQPPQEMRMPVAGLCREDQH